MVSLMLTPFKQVFRHSEKPGTNGVTHADAVQTGVPPPTQRSQPRMVSLMLTPFKQVFRHSEKPGTNGVTHADAVQTGVPPLREANHE